MICAYREVLMSPISTTADRTLGEAGTRVSQNQQWRGHYFRVCGFLATPARSRPSRPSETGHPARRARGGGRVPPRPPRHGHTRSPEKERVGRQLPEATRERDGRCRASGSRLCRSSNSPIIEKQAGARSKHPGPSDRIQRPLRLGAQQSTRPVPTLFFVRSHTQNRGAVESHSPALVRTSRVGPPTHESRMEI